MPTQHHTPQIVYATQPFVRLGDLIYTFLLSPKTNKMAREREWEWEWGGESGRLATLGASRKPGQTFSEGI